MPREQAPAFFYIFHFRILCTHTPRRDLDLPSMIHKVFGTILLILITTNSAIESRDISAPFHFCAPLEYLSSYHLFSPRETSFARIYIHISEISKMAVDK